MQTENWRDTGAKADREQREKRGQRRRRGERRRGGEEREEREREREICGDWSPFIHSTHLAYLAGAGNEISSFQSLLTGGCEEIRLLLVSRAP